MYINESTIINIADSTSSHLVNTKSEDRLHRTAISLQSCYKQSMRIFPSTTLARQPPALGILSLIKLLHNQRNFCKVLNQWSFGYPFEKEVFYLHPLLELTVKIRLVCWHIVNVAGVMAGIHLLVIKRYACITLGYVKQINNNNHTYRAVETWHQKESKKQTNKKHAIKDIFHFCNINFHAIYYFLPRRHSSMINRSRLRASESSQALKMCVRSISIDDYSLSSYVSFGVCASMCLHVYFWFA